MKRRICFTLLGMTALASGVESFEDYPAGAFETLNTPLGTWSAGSGQAEVHQGHAKAGNQSLRLPGGGEQALELELAGALTKPSRLSFWAERWTARKPFLFRIDAAGPGGDYEEVWNGDGAVKVGGFLTPVEVPLEAGVSRLRIRCNAPEKSGVMLDLLKLEEEKPMRLLEVDVAQPVVPVLKRKAINPVLGLRVSTEGNLKPLKLEAVEVEMEGTTRPEDLAAIELVPGDEDPSGGWGDPFGDAGRGPKAVFAGDAELSGGDNWWWVSVRLKDDADIDGRVDARVTRVKISGKVIDVVAGSAPGAQRIGVALRQHGDDGSKAYRIPGMVRTKEGTLIAVYDIRYDGGRDLPGNIDVGASRSTDGGRSWEPMRVAMDMGPGGGDGVGDPCVFVDRVTGRIWIAALWSHGNRAWHGSGPGLEPDETGQLVMVHSDDDGRTWSKPRNITREVKDPAWRLLLNGPGTGITMKDGTLVFPAQYRAADGKPWSTMIWSKDRGETWKIGTGVKSDTTEAQLVELEDGVIMINCRDNRGGSRTVATTKDLGASWQLHPTDRKALPESICMASLLKWDVPGGDETLFFSNPATTSGRHTMTVKVSEDLGMSWPESMHTLYDKRSGAGYSCLAPADDAHLGILYEGPVEIYFLRIPVDELLERDEGGAFDPGSGARRNAPATLVPLPREIEWGGGKLEPGGWSVKASGDLGRASRLLDRMPVGEVELAVFLGPVAGGSEAYEMAVDESGVRLVGASDLGLLRGLSTLQQLTAEGELPFVHVHDWPAFPVRGFMHDVGRNFQEVETIERFIGTMASLKMNVFHWHLTDYPGYRIESKRHPVLNEKSSYRQTRQPGRFYTFEQIRGLFRKAHALGVEVLPEIDMPGHSEYFNTAFGFGMQDPRGMEICADLLDEFCDEVIVPLRKEGVSIPRFHLGSDEVRITNAAFLPKMVEVLRGHGLEVVVWRPGGLPDAECITQLWAKGKPAPGVRFIDSAVNYVNHMDFLDGPPHAFYWQPCWRPEGDGQALGAILCHWPDINTGGEENIYTQSPVLPAMVAAAERFWRGLPEDHPDLWSQLPSPGDPRLEPYRLFERDLLTVGRRLAREWPFPYHAQTSMRWRVIGPFPHGGDTTKTFPPESMERLGPVVHEGISYEPFEVAGGTIHFRNFFGLGGVLPGAPTEGTAYAETRVWSDEAREIPCWIGFNTPSTSDRRAGPMISGKWSHEDGRVWVNGEELEPPRWENEGYMPAKTARDERPFVNEGYAYREPALVKLDKGWNRVLVKAPKTSKGWKWMFTFLPLEDDLKIEP
ncbi:family 20 glycosylhydrolase [Haloferula sp. A504]|uniref:family 20 glycosylhydrolase n=1 Tax=Haloferula sp. A504 TaxID=3373601 RepID=UPI0031BC6CE0|nr:family 20 glycosylhydrolase [Verrucomicrobiaceae bacterium E54]